MTENRSISLCKFRLGAESRTRAFTVNQLSSLRGVSSATSKCNSNIFLSVKSSGYSSRVVGRGPQCLHVVVERGGRWMQS